MAVRAVRGATALQVDDAGEMREAVVELLTEMLSRNGLGTGELISLIFTATGDLHSAFPAAAARTLDIADVPLICAQELVIESAMPRVVRIMAHVETDIDRADITHVYLRGTESLRVDLTQ